MLCNFVSLPPAVRTHQEPPDPPHREEVPEAGQVHVLVADVEAAEAEPRSFSFHPPALPR